jgi:sec-independent protein translocase protein TatA
MLGSLGAPELIIIAVVLILLFGVGKVSGLGRELGSSIKEFRRAVKDENAEQEAPPVQQATTQAPPPQTPPAQQYTPPPAQQQPPQQHQGEHQPPNVF